MKSIGVTSTCIITLENRIRVCFFIPLTHHKYIKHRMPRWFLPRGKCTAISTTKHFKAKWVWKNASILQKRPNRGINWWMASNKTRRGTRKGKRGNWWERRLFPWQLAGHTQLWWMDGFSDGWLAWDDTQLPARLSLSLSSASSNQQRFGFGLSFNSFKQFCF